MTTETEKLQRLAEEEYKYGFYTDVEADSLPPGLNEQVMRHLVVRVEEEKETTKPPEPAAE